MGQKYVVLARARAIAKIEAVFDLSGVWAAVFDLSDVWAAVFDLSGAWDLAGLWRRRSRMQWNGLAEVVRGRCVELQEKRLVPRRGIPLALALLAQGLAQA